MERTALSVFLLLYPPPFYCFRDAMRSPESSFAMTVQEQNPGRSLRTSGITYWGLCRCLSGLPGVELTHRRRFFWRGGDVRAEFAFCGHAYQIETDVWDGALWIMTKDGEARIAAMQELKDHLERRCLSGRISRFLKRKIA